MEQQTEQTKVETTRSHGPADALYLLAYNKWVATDPQCRCQEHGTKLERPDCQREIFWRIYCKARDSKELTANEIFLIGAN